MVVNSHAQCFQYNPYHKHLRVASEMEIKVKYYSSAGGDRGYSQDLRDLGVAEDFVSLYRSTVWNYDQLGYHGETIPIDYLIITGDSYMLDLNPLVALLRSRGYDVVVKKMSEISSIGDPWAVYSYINDMYVAHKIQYVLLVGDVRDNYGSEPFSAYKMVPFPYWLPGFDYDDPKNIRPSDVCYACLGNDEPPPTPPDSPEWYEWWKNSDWYPDVYVGRLTADNSYHVDVQVNKIRTYELGLDPPPQQPIPWYDRMLFVAHEEDYGFDFNDDKKNKIMYGEYDIPLPYVRYRWGGEDEPLTPTNETIMSDIDEGCNIVNYWGHGGMPCWSEWTRKADQWGQISFYGHKYHVPKLENEHLVVTFNIGCSMACIDTWHDYDTLCDHWLWEDRGAVASIGATRSGYQSGHKYDKALFEVMYGVHGDPITHIAPINGIGTVHYGAITRYYTNYPGLWALKTIHIHILLGEPSMNIRNKYTEEMTGSLSMSAELVEEKPLEVSIYPNPSSGIFIMKYNGDISGIGEINIYDISGRLVDVVEISGIDNRASDTKAGLYEGELMLDLTTLSDGLYIVNIGDNLQKRVLICR